MSQPKDAPRAKDFMNRHLQTVAPDTPLAEIVASLLKHKVSNLPVVEERDGKSILVGFISEGDCLEHLSNELFYGNPSPPQSARTIMKRHPVCIAPDTNLFTLASIFVSHSFRHLPVVENETLLGMVSRRDILRATDEYYRNLTQQKAKDRLDPDLREIINVRFLSSE